MLIINFQGWFQCRLATNPDPTDEPRGVSGFTFALAGEPDLDRRIRLQDPVAPRSHGPGVGVDVDSVFLRGRKMTDSPLMGGKVELLDGARFESRNLLLTEDESGVGLIHPFHIRISAGDIVIDRLDILCPDQPNLELHKVPPRYLRRRAPVSLKAMTHDPMLIAEATGIVDAVAYRTERRHLLMRDLEKTSDPVQRAALQKRIHELKKNDPDKVPVVFMKAVQTRRFALNGPAEVADPWGQLPPGLELSAEWPIEFWMGCWDADALCGFMRGRIEIPVQEK